MGQKKYYIETTTEGCATNLIENSMYSNYFETNQIERTMHPQDADYIILNTCAFTEGQEKKSLQRINGLKKDYGDKKIIAGGCLTKINPKEFNKAAPQKEGFLPGDIEKLAQLSDLPFNEKILEESLSYQFNPTDFSKLTIFHKLIFMLRTFYFRIEGIIGKKAYPLHNIISSAVINQNYYAITLSQGCAGKCTFCAIKTVKGHVKSKPLHHVMHEFQKGIDMGHRKFWLLGDDIGCFGIDNGESVTELLKSILEIPVDFELVINYFEPYFLIKHEAELFDIFSDSRIVNINIPIQSGNDHIIKSMGREYNTCDVKRVLAILKKANPKLAIKTNLIVGFPGETFKQFLESVTSVFWFDAIYALTFTAKNNTRAKAYPDQISIYQKKSRYFLIQFFILVRHIQVAMLSLIGKSTL